jgi:hypothetical protein
MNSEQRVYRIKDWSQHFENNRTKEMVNMRWVPVPNKHDGEGFCTIMSQPDGMVIYAAWHLILQVASKCGTRGTLLRDNGTPHTAQSIAVKTRCNDAQAIQRALDFCSSPQIGWIEALVDNPAPSCGNPAPSCAEGKGIEGKRREEKKVAIQTRGRVRIANSDFIESLRAGCTADGIDLDGELRKMQRWLTTPKGRGRKLTQQFVVNWLNKCDRAVRDSTDATDEYLRGAK